MPAALTLNLNGSVTGLAAGSLAVGPASVTSAAAVGQRSLVNFVLGTNTIAIPLGTTSVVIVPPSGNTVSMLLKGVAADTGFRLHNTAWAVIPIDPSTTSFVITAGAAITGVDISFL